MSNVYNSGLAYDYTGLTYDGATAPGSGFPIPGIFIAFDDGPYTVNPAWTDVTQYVQAATTRRGKTSDYENFGTGLAQIVLNNQTQRFSPFNTTGPYYGKLLPRRQIKIVAQIGGINYDVYRGYIAGWPVDYSQAGYNSTVTLQCFDALGLMVNEVIPTDWADVYTKAASPSFYWKCNDSQGTTVLSEQIVGTAWEMTAVAGTPSYFEVSPLAQGLINNSVFCRFYRTPSPPIYSSETQIFSFWIRNNAGGATGAAISFESYQARYTFSQTATSTELLFTGTTTFAQRIFSVTSDYRPVLGVPFHVTVYANSTAPTIFINNVQVTYTTTSPGVSSLGPMIKQVTVQNAEIAEIAWWLNGSLSTEQRTNIYNAGVARFTETTTARANRIISQTNYPAALTDFTPAPAGTVSEIGTNSTSVTELQKVSQSEGGDLFATKAGLLKTTNRTYVYDNPSSNLPQIVFSDAGGATLRYGPELSLDWDADSIRNDLTVTFTGGGQYSTLDAASIAAYGAASYGIDTQLSTPAQAQALATTDLTANAALKPKFSPLNVGVTVVAADWQKILGLELLDCVEIVRTPTGGSVVDYRVLVYEIEHTITPQVWETTLSGSARYSDWFTLDVSELDGPDPLL